MQAAVDTTNHLIVAHEVTNIGTRRHQLATMTSQAREALGAATLEVVADRGYYEGGEIKACADAGITTLTCSRVSVPMSSFSHGCSR